MCAIAGCSDDAAHWRWDDLKDPAAALARVEAKWLAEVEHRGSILHEDARCYFQLRPPFGDVDDSLEPLIACGPVSHWYGFVGPTPTPTAHEYGTGDPEYDPATFRKPYAGDASNWDYYRFMNMRRSEEDPSVIDPTGPVAWSQNEVSPTMEEVARFIRHDGLEPPTDMGRNLPIPDPPPDAVIPLNKTINVDVDEQYRPGPYIDGDLAVTYNLDITGGTWEATYEGTRILTLDIEADIDVAEDYRLNYDPSDSATADPDNGGDVSAITRGALTTYEVDPDSSDHPPLIFHLPHDARTATIELDPDVQYTATDDDFDLDPRGGILDLPTERFTVRLVTDEQAEAAEPK